MSDGKSIRRPHRGGSWDVGPQYARVVSRFNVVPGDRGTGLGVRLVEEVEDPELPPASGSRRGILGSTWYSPPQFARAAARGYDAPGNRNGSLGVRLVDEVEEDQTPASGSDRVLRGGCWNSDPRFARVAYRNRVAPGSRNSRLGVRLVEEVTDA